MDSEDFCSDAVWVTDDVKRLAGSGELARFSFRFSPNGLRTAARALALAGATFLRVTSEAQVLVVEVSLEEVGLAVGTCLDHGGRYVRAAACLS